MRPHSRQHRPYCRKRVTIDPNHDYDLSSTVPRHSEGFFCSDALPVDAVRVLPYINSGSWLYLDPNPVFRVAAPVMSGQNLEYGLPPPRRKLRHHHHHHHHRHHHHGRHRRVISDPGGIASNVSYEEGKRHRRGFSFDMGIAGSSLLTDSINGIAKTQSPDDARTSTFRKVPWHPNLHMLKIRRA